MNPRVQVVVEWPLTLVELERACAAARERGFVDDAQVLAPSLLAYRLVIVQPTNDVGRPVAGDEPVLTDGAPA